MLVGLVLVIAGIHSILSFNSLKKKCTANTTGVIFYTKKTSHSKGSKYIADASFTVNAKDYTCHLSSRSSRYTQGTHIKVNYDPSSPNTNYSPDYPPSKGFGWLIIGILAEAVGLISLIANKRINN